jgi:DNA repair exonuclease SbcCD ATPase subunit
MAEIDGGSLSFKSILDNGQLNAAIDETLRRVQGFSDAVAGSGDVMDKTTQEMVECIEIQRKVIQDLENSYNDLTAKINAIEPGDAQNQLIEQANSVKQELDAEKQGLVDLMNELNNLQRTTSGAASSLDQIRVTLGQIGAACEEHEQAIAKLSAEYDRVSHAASDAFMSGRDDDYRALQDRADAIKGEVTVRKQLLNELRNQSNALEDEAQKIEKAAQEAENAAQSHVSFRTRLREVREELMQLELAGDTSSERYKQLQAQMGELSEAMDAVTTQQNMLKRGERMWDGLLSGLSGVSGAFSAAQGAVALFSGENENLQKIMLKVQSLMAITIGLKEVQLALDKDEAFQLVTINGLKKWWNKLLAVGRGEQVAATAATAANIGLAGAFRMVGAAIKSIPVFDWIAAAIGALIAVISHFVSKANEGKKAAQEFYKSLAENAYKPIATIEELSLKWNALGDDLNAKKKFIEENKAAFDELGVAVLDVVDAENLLNKGKDAFVQAQIDKAKAIVLVQQAQEKVKTLLEEEQKLQAMPEKTSQWIQTSLFGTGYYVEVDNKKKDEQEQKVIDLRTNIEKLFKDAAAAESAGWEKLKEAGIAGTDTYEKGTLGAIEKAIQTEQEALKHLTNNDEYKAKMREIEKLQKQADAITGKKATTTTKTSTNTQDPFIEKLNKYRSEYQRFQKWVNSGDEVLVRSANQEFSKLLAEGATYIDYLKNQRDQILQIDVANRTKAQNKQLRQLNDAIAEETRTTVLEAFNEELNAQLTNARTVLDMLNIIEQKRKELSGDGTELDNAKAESLNEAEENAQDQLRQETESLLEEYASYVEQKRRLEQQFNDDVALMMREREKATTDAQRAEIDNAIQNRTNQYNKDVRNIGGVDYDAMLAEYGTFEERKQAIIDDYDEKRRAAQEAGNTEMVEAIDRAQAQALSKFALDELQAHPDWELMFGDLDEISTKKLQELIDKINNLDGAYLGIEFDPKDLETLKNKIKEMQNEIRERNPFKSLISSIKEYGKAADDESKKKALTNMFESASGAIDLVGGAFDAVTSGLEKMGVTMDEQTQAIIGDIGGILDGAGQVASGIATGNPLSIIQGSIGLLSSAFDLFNSRDRKAEKSIKRHQEAIDKLKASYEQLEWAVDKALGAEVYNNQMGLIHNMEQQQAHLRGMISDEQSKKKTDNGKIQDYQNQIAELDRQIQDMYDEIANDILQTNAKDFASTLADSLTEAFKAGEDAANAFEQTVNEVLQNAIVNQLKKKFLENQLQSALDSLYTDMGYWSGDNFIFDGLTDAEIADFKAKVQAAANNYNQALDVYKDLFKDLEIDDDSEDSLTGAVKGVTEETADIIAGQMNAIRINQMEATQVLRQSLQALNTIANNTAYNRLLQDILSAVRELQRPSGDSLRSQGLS